MLLNSLSATENILGSAHNNNNNPTSSKSHFAEPDSAEQQSDNMGNNVKLRAKQVVSPKDKSTAPTRVSAPAVMNEESANKANTLPKTETGKSVIVNLALPGGTIDEKHRLTRLLREVNEMREIRERHDSYASEQSLEANILKNKDKELQRITKIQRSKKLLFKYKVYQYLKRPTSFAAMVYHVFAFILVASCLILSVFPAMERQMGKVINNNKLAKVNSVNSLCAINHVQPDKFPSPTAPNIGHSRKDRSFMVHHRVHSHV